MLLDVNKILDRAKKAANIEDDVDLFRLMELNKQSNISNWRRRGTIPWAELYALCEKMGWSMDWLLKGEEDTREEEGLEVITIPRGTLAHIPVEILEIFNGDDNDAKSLMIKYAQHIKHLRLKRELTEEEIRYAGLKRRDWLDQDESGIEDVLDANLLDRKKEAM